MPAILTAEASAPGKLILFGEHAVVYGVKAIAGALSDLRISVSAGLFNSGKIVIKLNSLDPEGGQKLIREWDLESVRALCGTHFSSSHAEQPILPNPILMSCLDTLAEGFTPFEKKAYMPLLFLIVAVFAPSIFSPDSICPSFPGVELIVNRPTLPIGAGLGSSAALSVATSACLLDLWCRWTQNKSILDLASGSPPRHAGSEEEIVSSQAKPVEGWSMPSSKSTLNLISEWAFSAETLFHGAPSGLDNTVSTFGGAIVYTRAMPATQTSPAVPAVFTPIANMPALPLLVVNTRIPKDTAALVGKVREYYNAAPEIVNPLLDAVRAIVNAAHIALEGENTLLHSRTDNSASENHPPGLSKILFHTMRQLIHSNHGILNALGVGHAALDRLVEIAQRFGTAAKLTGAGGGGCGFVLVPPATLLGPSPEEDEVLPGGGEKAVREMSEQLSLGMNEYGEFDCFETKVGGDGVLVRRY